MLISLESWTTFFFIIFNPDKLLPFENETSALALKTKGCL